VDLIRRHDQDYVPRAPMRDFITQHLLFFGMAAPPLFSSNKGSVHAELNGGRWVIDCASSSCASASMASIAEPYFLCPECGSPENGGNWYNVEFPSNRARVETLLLRRPNEENRNWKYGEEVSLLEQDNREHGLDDS
jgi:hypothetical protein